MIKCILQLPDNVFCCFLWLVALIEVAEALTPQSNAPECTDTLTTFYQSVGNISSPNYPSNYPDNARCRWSIISPANQTIEINFESFNIELSRSCQYDFVTIFDGNEQLAAARYCGRLTPTPFISNSSKLTIIFKSDEGFNRTGFFLRWNFRDRCTREEFTCWDQTCISRDKHCDQVKDCADNSDEMECARSSQDMNECGKQDIAPHFTWDPRIVEGNEAIPGSWPWHAELVFVSSQKTFCGGSIIHPKAILTAAHCVEILKSVSQVEVVVGRHHTRNRRGYQLIKVRNFMMHSDFYLKTFANDVAFLELASSITFTKTIRPICLPPKNNPKFAPKDGTICIATGFGDTDPTENGVLTSNSLFQVRLPIANVNHCMNQYANTNAPVNSQSQLCAGAGNGDACQGDSGGPLMCLFGESTWYQVGITSFGLDCNDAAYPGVYQKVSFYDEWIEKRLGWIDACTTSLRLTETTGYFHSPNYPDGYHSNSRCEWKIIGSPGQKIQIKYINVKLHSECTANSGDFLEIFDGNFLKYRFCGNTAPVDFTSDTENVTVIFTTDDSGANTGFSIRWNALTEPRADSPMATTIDIFSETETTTGGSAAHHICVAKWLHFVFLVFYLFTFFS